MKRGLSFTILLPLSETTTDVMLQPGSSSAGQPQDRPQCPAPWIRLPRPTRHLSDGGAPRAPCSVQPCRDRRAPLESGGVPPHVEKHFTQEVLGQGIIVYEPQQPPIQRHPIPCEERSHSGLVACSDPSDQRFIRRTFARRCPFRQRGNPYSTDGNRSHRRQTERGAPCSSRSPMRCPPPSPTCALFNADKT
jgi:hypothetical protein